MSKLFCFVFGGQQYDETVLFCVWRAAVCRNCSVLCLEGSSMTKRFSFVFGGQQYDETFQFCVWRAAVNESVQFCVWRTAV
jgi:hypothetical protein